MSLSIYGKLPSGKRLERIRSSAQYRHGSFQNISPTPAMAEDASFYKIACDYLNKPNNVKPGSPIPAKKQALSFKNQNDVSLLWLGHSSYLLFAGGKTILVDPVMSGNAAPVKFMVKAFAGADVYTPDDLPPIDILLLTHDHYDHLDYKTVLQLKPKVKQVICSLGLGSHLEHWGYPLSKITELDWWESADCGNVNFTAVPARHFSGRGIKRGQTLWSAFVLETGKHRFFLGGDSGYDAHFAETGKRFGKFDLAILECGQYNKLWPNIHMMPEQTAQAALDLGAKLLLPVHWGKFALAFHAWNEPIERLMEACRKPGLSITTPLPGTLFKPLDESPATKWWENL